LSSGTLEAGTRAGGREPGDERAGCRLRSPWKRALELFIPDFMAFFFPIAHGDIDWRRGYQLLDKELQQAARRRRRKDRKAGGVRADRKQLHKPAASRPQVCASMGQ
jgi:hypothetical protein